MRTEINACDCTRRLYGHRKRVCTDSCKLWEKNPLPHRGIEPLIGTTGNDKVFGGGGRIGGRGPVAEFDNPGKPHYQVLELSKTGKPLSRRVTLDCHGKFGSPYLDKDYSSRETSATLSYVVRAALVCNRMHQHHLCTLKIPSIAMWAHILLEALTWQQISEFFCLFFESVLFVALKKRSPPKLYSFCLALSN